MTRTEIVIILLCGVVFEMGEHRTNTLSPGFVNRSGLLETHVRGQWFKVYVSLEDDYLSITLDESCENTTTLNGTLNNNNIETPGALNSELTPDVPESIANQNRCVRVCKSDNNGLGISIKVRFFQSYNQNDTLVFFWKL